MRVRQARAQFQGPDVYTISALKDNDPAVYFNVRLQMLDGTLTPVTTDIGKVEFVLVAQADGSRREIHGQEVAEGVWEFLLASDDISLAHNWRVDSVVDGRRTTHALGAFAYER